MANNERPNQTGSTEPERKPQSSDRDGDLERRRRQLDSILAEKRPAAEGEADKPKSGGMAGFGNAMKLSSEFIAGILVGAGLGWVIDYWAGTSPWGLIVFLFLGFGAGVLNVLRSAGMVAEADAKAAAGKGGLPPKA